jgi:hypothetical protein
MQRQDEADRQLRELWLADIRGPSTLPPEERRANLVRAKKSLEADLERRRGTRHARELGQRIHLLDQHIRALNVKKRGPHGTAEHFVDVVRERVTAAQFRIYLSEASERARRAEATS